MRSNELDMRMRHLKAWLTAVADANCADMCKYICGLSIYIAGLIGSPKKPPISPTGKHYFRDS